MPVCQFCVCVDYDLHCSLWHTQQTDRETAVSRSSQKLAANVGKIEEQQDNRHLPCRNQSWLSSPFSTLSLIPIVNTPTEQKLRYETAIVEHRDTSIS